MKIIKYEVTWTQIFTLISIIISAIANYFYLNRVEQRLDLRDAKFITADRSEKREIKEAYNQDRMHLLKLIKHCENGETKNSIRLCEIPIDLLTASPEVQLLPETLLMIEAEKKEKQEN